MQEALPAGMYSRLTHPEHMHASGLPAVVPVNVLPPDTAEEMALVHKNWQTLTPAEALPDLWG